MLKLVAVRTQRLAFGRSTTGKRFGEPSRLGAGFGGMGGMFPQQRVPLVQALLAAGADPNVRITSSAMIMSYIGYPKKGAFEPYACGTGDLRGATPLWVAAFGANGSFGQIFAEFAFYNRANSSADVVRALLDGGADQHLTTDDGTTPLMAAAGLGPSTYTPREPRGLRSRNGEGAVKVLLEAGADINAVNEADFTALHGAVFRGLNEVVQFLVENGADINARDFRGRTPYRMAEGAKQSFQFQSWPETADLLKTLGADTRLGIPGTVQERLRDIPARRTSPVNRDVPRRGASPALRHINEDRVRVEPQISPRIFAGLIHERLGVLGVGATHPDIHVAVDRR